MSEERLLAAAADVRQRAYAPYSSFQVGAALYTETGDLHRGCNVENVSYGLTMCAERVAIGAAVAAGMKKVRLLALVSDSPEPVVPCGACRQVLAEFNPSLRILSQTVGGQSTEFALNALLPSPDQGLPGVPRGT